jgi:hypothetical protein
VLQIGSIFSLFPSGIVLWPLLGKILTPVERVINRWPMLISLPVAVAVGLPLMLASFLAFPILLLKIAQKVAPKKADTAYWIDGEYRQGNSETDILDTGPSITYQYPEKFPSDPSLYW